MILQLDRAGPQVDPENLEKELTDVSFGLSGVVKEVEAFLRAGKTTVILDDGDEIDDEYGDTMTEFVGKAEQAVLSKSDAQNKSKSPGELWVQIDSTKEALNKLVKFFGAMITATRSLPLRLA
eukprot:COSAG02_NODE_5195_length_4551_cov_1.826370_7_plen_123_part_00